MPLYEVLHSMPLSEEQQSQIAERITHIHTRQFTTPSLFVNVTFKDVAGTPHFVGGRKRAVNMINAYVRPGRAKEDFDSMCQQVGDAWNEIIKPQKEIEKLRLILVQGSIIAGYEAGFHVPAAGEDQAWLKENLAAIQKRAQEGDEDFVLMLKELTERKDLQANGA